jgi:K+/H+ antiporter YhaU regulatory subunit KhtT
MSKSPLGTPGVNTEISATVMLAVKQGARLAPSPPLDPVLAPGDHLPLVGTSSDLRAVEGGA